MNAPIDIYARVSLKGDKEQRSTDSQVAVCRAVLAERGLPEGEVFVDDGKSAWNRRVRRPGWEALMARLESGAAGGVIVFDLERFTRRPDDGSRLIKAAGCGMLVLDSDQVLDLTTASGIKSFRDALAAAEYYSNRLSDRVKRGKAAKARAGEPNGSTRPFGFEDDRITVREDEAAVLRALTDHFLHGDSQDALLDWLGRLGIPTAYGGEWCRTALRQLLTRERNAGQIVYRGSIVGRLPGEPIIDPDTFARVQAKYAARRPGRPPSPKYLCSGVAVCGKCGKRMCGRPRKNVKPYDDGEDRREYKCSKSSYGGCGRITIDQRGLDEAAKELAISILSDPRHASQIEAAAARRADEARDLDALIAADEATALALADRLGRGEMDLARYDAATGPLDRRLADLRRKRAALGDPDTAGPESGIDWATRWEVALPDERRALLRRALRGRVLAVNPAVMTDRTNVSLRLEIRRSVL
jgi:DNA invertase Pin-like site-specific DNA recombinase